MTFGLWFDLGVFALLLLVGWLYSQKGFAAALVQMVGNLISMAGAMFLSQKVAPPLFELFWKNSFTAGVQETLFADSGTISAVVDEYAGFLPASLQRGIEAAIQKTLESGAPNLANAIVKQVLEPLLTPLIAIVLFFLAFAFCRFFVSLLVAVLKNANRLPLVGGANRLLGFVAGLGAGLVDIYLVLCALWCFMALTGHEGAYFQTGALADSYVFQLFCTFNPFQNTSLVY